MTRVDHEEALRLVGVLPALAAFDPHVAGTPPLGLALPSSDIDILCHAPDPMAFADAVTRVFGHLRDFQLVERPRWQAVIARFHAHGWPFEIFGQPLPVAQQQGWRHFLVERRLLALGGGALASTILALRAQGLKTEPAFAQLLGLTGDPYAALLDLEAWDDEALRTLLPAG